MAFPAAPTESGGAKLHFGTTEGNAAAGWFAVDTGVTGTGTNTVGFLGIATHVHDDPAGAPGGLSTSSVPLVVAGAVRDDALAGLTPAEGDAVYLLTDEDGALWTHDNVLAAALDGSELQVDIVAALPAGANAIGKLAANSGVDIGDVDVTSMPGTAAESGALPAVFVVVAGDDGTNTHPLQMSATGDLKVTLDTEPVVLGTGSAAIGKLAANSGVDIGDVDVTSMPATAAEGGALPAVFAVVAGDDGTDTHPLQVAVDGDLKVTLDSEAVVLGTGSAAIGKLAANSGVDIGDVDVLSLPSLSAGTNAIGKLAANSGVDIGDVDVTTITGVTMLNAAMQVTGDEAHDAPDAGNPFKIGGRAQSPWAAPDEVADEDRVDALFDRNGRQVVRGDFDPKYADINDDTSGNNTIIAAVAGKRIAVWSYFMISDGTVDARWEDGAGGTPFTGQVPLQEREGWVNPAGGLNPLFVGAVNTLLNLELSANIRVHGSVSYSLWDD